MKCQWFVFSEWQCENSSIYCCCFICATTDQCSSIRVGIAGAVWSDEVRLPVIAFLCLPISTTGLFSGECAGELSFAAGRIVKLLRYVDDEWLEGELDGKTGIFPVSYVDTVIDCPPPAVASIDVRTVRDSGELADTCGSLV